MMTTDGVSFNKTSVRHRRRMSTASLEAPVGRCFKNLSDSIAFGRGYSSRSLVSYIVGDLTHVSPAAYVDYVQGKDWPTLLSRVREMLEENPEEDVAEALHISFLENLRK